MLGRRGVQGLWCGCFLQSRCRSFGRRGLEIWGIRCFRRFGQNIVQGRWGTCAVQLRCCSWLGTWGGGAAAAAAALFGTGLLASVALLDASACGGIAFGGGAGFAFPPAGGTVGQLFGTTTGGGDTCTGVAFALVDGDEDSATCAPTFRLAAVAFALARMACTKSMLGVGAGAGGAFTALGGMRNPARITADKHEKLGNTWNDNI